LQFYINFNLVVIILEV